jgi:hypothetical protein
MYPKYYPNTFDIKFIPIIETETAAKAFTPSHLHLSESNVSKIANEINNTNALFSIQ